MGGEISKLRSLSLHPDRNGLSSANGEIDSDFVGAGLCFYFKILQVTTMLGSSLCLNTDRTGLII